MRDYISVEIESPVKRVYEIMTNLEKIKIWEPSKGMLKIGHILRIKPPSGLLSQGVLR